MTVHPAMPADIVSPRFTVCICTRNRPGDLTKALESILASAYPAHQIIVSDDSTDERTRLLIAARYPSVTYLEGPRVGLGANRNNGIAAATGTHILFIDDDVVLGREFLSGVADELGADTVGPNVIVSGTEINHGVRVFPHKVNYLGYQALDYATDVPHDTIVINATVFPRELFQLVRFDPSLVYGCDEMDISVRAVHLHGYRIHFVAGLANEHYPSEVNRDYYASFIEASRIYVQFKRYYWVERRCGKALAFLVIAYLHILLHYLKIRRLGGFAAFGQTFSRSFGYITNCFDGHRCFTDTSG